MDPDFSKNKSSLTDAVFRDGHMSRRELLVITAKAAAGLTILPVSSLLASGQQEIEIKMPDDLPVPLGSLNSATSCMSYLAGDINGDCRVDEEDLEIMSQEWLTDESSARSNLDCSCTYIPNSASSMVCVDFQDYPILANDWRKSSSAVSAISIMNLRKPMKNHFACSARQRFKEEITRKIIREITSI